MEFRFQCPQIKWGGTQPCSFISTKPGATVAPHRQSGEPVAEFGWAAEPELWTACPCTADSAGPWNGWQCHCLPAWRCLRASREAHRTPRVARQPVAPKRIHRPSVTVYCGLARSFIKPESIFFLVIFPTEFHQQGSCSQFLSKRVCPLMPEQHTQFLLQGA